ncbi:hypothetical protein J6590_002985 [Homalodisca vitripennis]|nr:hypothetical protein J6590_002985 [Homalodisca vitripennis]
MFICLQNDFARKNVYVKLEFSEPELGRSLSTSVEGAPTTLIDPLINVNYIFDNSYLTTESGQAFTVARNDENQFPPHSTTDYDL